MSKKYYPLRDPDSHKPVSIQINETINQAIAPEIQRQRAWLRYHGFCSCPKSAHIICDLDCAFCKYQRYGRHSSLESLRDNSGVELADEQASLMEECLVDKLVAEELMKRLRVIYPEALHVLRLQEQGLSERKSLRLLDIPQTTYRRRFAAAIRMLRKEFGLEK